MKTAGHIAERLSMIEAARPGTIKIRVNPLRLDDVVAVLNRLGLRKGFFTGAEEFFSESFRRSQEVMVRILPSMMLVGPTNGEGLVQCWSGSSCYAGTMGIAAMADWRTSGMDRVVGIINVEPYFHEIGDLLEGPANRETPAAQADPQILSHMAQGHGGLIAELLAISDTQIRDQAFSLLYFTSEIEFSALKPAYTHPRLLGGNPFENLARFMNSAPDILAVKEELDRALLFYTVDRSTANLNIISKICSEVLARNDLKPIVGISRLFG